MDAAACTVVLLERNPRRKNLYRKQGYELLITHNVITAHRFLRQEMPAAVRS